MMPRWLGYATTALELWESLTTWRNLKVVCDHLYWQRKEHYTEKVAAAESTEQVVAAESRCFEIIAVWSANQDSSWILITSPEPWKFYTKFISLEYDVKHKKIQPTQIPTRTEKEQVTSHCAQGGGQSPPFSASTFQRLYLVYIRRPNPLKRDKTLGWLL